MLPEELRTRYDPVEVLGEGGFGRVVAAQDRDLDRPVAIKLLHAALVDEESLGRFRREAAVTARVQHPHVVALLDSGVLEDGTPYLVYERIEGQDLEAEPPDAAELPEVARRVAGALAAAHELGIVHRDVKPANVLRRNPGDPVLADFGIARVDDAGTQYTAEGIILGTPSYMAPELYLGELPSPASDQFAWAASLVAMAGGGSVYGTDEVPEILTRVRRPNPVRIPSQALPGLGDLAPVVERALAPQPEQRFPDMATFAAALSQPDSRQRRADTRPRGPPPDATVLEGLTAPPSAEATAPLDATLDGSSSTRALEPLRGSVVTTRKILVGDGSLAALAWRSVAAAVLLGGLGWWFGREATPDSPALPPSAAPGSPRASEASRALRRSSDEVRELLAGVDYASFEKPTQEELEEVYGQFIDPRLPSRWERWLEAMVTWLQSTELAQLDDPAHREQIERDIHATGLITATWAKELTWTLRLGNPGMDTIMELGGNSRRRSFPPEWDRSAIRQLDLELTASARRNLCDLDELELQQIPPLALALGHLASLLELWEPTDEAREHGCVGTGQGRFEHFVRPIHQQLILSDRLREALPWLRALVRTLDYVKDAGLLSLEDRRLYLEEATLHVEAIADSGRPTEQAEAWALLVREWWRTPFRFEREPREESVAAVKTLLPRWAAVAASAPEVSRRTIDAIRAYKSQNFLAEIHELEALHPELDALAATLPPRSN